ncbi:MAG: hypothetical protein ACREMA_09105 [Longimicrobiales bacterium]
MKRSSILIALAAALAACSETTGPSNVLGGGKGPPVIVVQNRTPSAIATVFISACSVTTWGANWLGSSETIGQNADRPFTVSAGCWDLRVETADQRYVERMGTAVAAGDRFPFTVTAF